MLQLSGQPRTSLTGKPSEYHHPQARSSLYSSTPAPGY